MDDGHSRGVIRNLLLKRPDLSREKLKDFGT